MLNNIYNANGEVSVDERNVRMYNGMNNMKNREVWRNVRCEKQEEDEIRNRRKGSRENKFLLKI